jgi:hypothetical protein
MNRTGWVLAMFVAAQAAGAAKLEITLQVHNAARAPEAELRKALAEASWILGQAGVETHWLDCGDSVRDGAELPGCEPRTETGVFVLSIVSQDPRAPGSGDVLGFAVLAGRGNGAAVIYSHILSKLKENPQYAEWNIVASVIAHEVGHLLLRSPQHGEGIMKANWGAADFDAMKQRRLKFAPAQARKLGSTLQHAVVSPSSRGSSKEFHFPSN